MGLHPINPIAIHRHTNLPASTQVIDREEDLAPRELRTEIYQLFQGARRIELIQHSLYTHNNPRKQHMDNPLSYRYDLFPRGGL